MAKSKKIPSGLRKAVDDSLWKDDKIQFARLLCELVANCDDLKIRDVCESMDLSQDEINELFDRANDVWERAKRNFLLNK